jgi:DNA polymerase-3 subunit epsilon
VALGLLAMSQQSDLEHLAESLRVSVGRFDGTTWFSSRSMPGHGGAPQFSAEVIDKIRSAVGNSIHADPDGPLFGRRVAFTGGLASMTRAEAAARVLTVGGEPQVGVTKDTDFLVVGAENGYTLSPTIALTAKFDKAQRLREKGSNIEVLDELSFSRMV